VSDAADLEPELQPLTPWVIEARSGLRRHVQALMSALATSELLVPLARDMPDAPEGKRIEFDGSLTLVPHLLKDADGHDFAVLFTTPEPLDPIVDALFWKTDGEALKVCALPARLAFEMALEIIDRNNVVGLVIDPGAPSELCLNRQELASMLVGRALPLLAYVGDIPEDERGATLIAEGGEPPPVELVDALVLFCKSTPGVIGYRLQRTFNSDRDLEPHFTVTLAVTSKVNRHYVFQSVTQTIEGTVPPPGYLDVLFEEVAEEK
jgi:hypothetical protein